MGRHDESSPAGLVSTALTALTSLTALTVALLTFIPDVAAAQSEAPVAISAQSECFDQVVGDAPSAIISQNFEPDFDIYDTQAADDFVLTEPCRRPVLYIDGRYTSGVDEADSFNVTIYRSKRHAPGRLERQLEALPYTEPCAQPWGCTQIVLRKTLQPGHWWLSVQANLSYTDSGGQQWQWATNYRVRRIAAMWQNPGDGFGTSCTTYQDLIGCVGSGVGLGGDLSFSISSS